MPTEKRTSKELKDHLSALNAKLKNLNKELKPYQEETDLLKYTRSIVINLSLSLHLRARSSHLRLRKKSAVFLKGLQPPRKLPKKTRNTLSPRRTKGDSLEDKVKRMIGKDVQSGNL